MKKTISLVLAVIMAISVMSFTVTAEGASGLPFDDVNAGKWYYDTVKTVYDEGIMEGVTETTFAPEDPMTRAQIVTIFYRLADMYRTDLKNKGLFKDTTKTAWYADYLGWAVYAKLVDGYPDGTFRPNKAITRQELAKLIVGFLRYLVADADGGAITDGFTDEDRFPSWSKEYIEQLRETGLMAGDDKGRFNPTKTATRAEVATVIVRMMPYVEEALTPEPPPMGWNSYMVYHWAMDEDKIISQMDAMVDKGLAAAGYEYINLDDWWYTTRDEETNRVQVWEDHFPHGMKAIADAAHERGLKAGIYTDLGYNSCGSGESSLPVESGINVGLAAGKYVDDLNIYLGTGEYYDEYAKKTGTDPVECWGFDYIKVDSNGTKEGINPSISFSDYALAIDEIERATGRYIHFNMCRWYYEGPYQMVYGNSWRCGTDSYADFEYSKYAIDKMKRVSSYTVPGHYADMDMLLFGGMSLTEEQTTFAMWCMFSSPLILSCDMNNLTEDQLEFLTNEELIAIDQDLLGYAAAYICDLGDGCELYFKKTNSWDDGSSAVAVYNPTDKEQTVTVDLSTVCRSGKAAVRDAIAKEDISELEEITVTLPAHGCAVYTLLTDDGYTYEDIGDYRAYGVVNTEYDVNFGEINGDTQTMTIEELTSLMKRPEALRPVLIDARTPEEFAKGHMEYAINVQYTEVPEAISKFLLPLLIDRQGGVRDIVVYAADDVTLERACKELRKFRYNVYALDTSGS